MLSRELIEARVKELQERREGLSKAVTEIDGALAEYGMWLSQDAEGAELEKAGIPICQVMKLQTESESPAALEARAKECQARGPVAPYVDPWGPDFPDACSDETTVHGL